MANRKSPTTRSEQYMQGGGFDEDYGVPASEQLGYDGQAISRQRATDVAVLYDQSGGYIGYAAPGSVTSAAVWQIKKLDLSGGLTTTFADGNGNYDNIWDNRAALAYS